MLTLALTLTCTLISVTDGDTLRANLEKQLPVNAKRSNRPKDLPSVEKLRSLFSYDPDTGELHYLRRRGPAAPGKMAGFHGGKGRTSVKVDGKSYLVHRVCWAIFYGEHPPELIDHANGDPRDNRISNLRAATKTLNQANRSYKIPPSGFRGVQKHGTGWRAVISFNRKRRSLGVFPTPEDASAAYEAEAERLFGTYAVHRRGAS